MKKLHLLSGMIALNALAGINAMEQGRPAMHKMIDPLVEKREWPAIFSMLDQMRGTIDVNEYQYYGKSWNYQTAKWTLLALAADQGNFLAAKTLLEKYKANPNSTISSTHTEIDEFSPIMFACRNGDSTMIKLLLHYNADPNRETRWGYSAFSLANATSKRKRSELLEILNQYKK